MSTMTREWAISMAFSIILLLVFGLGLVWLNIERVDLAYELKKIQHQIDDIETLTGKLEVERNTLITPSRLREMAEQYHLGPACPGQIRRVTVAGEVQASPLTSRAAPAKGQARGAGEGATPAKTKGRHKP